MITQNFLEVTTAIGCPVQCLKYCPQEVLTSRYTGPRLMSYHDFITIISTVPPNVAIRFGGFCEPFVNPETAKMILYAHDAGHKIQLLTTLVGATIEDIRSLDSVEFEHILIHLPDANRIANIPVTSEYLRNLAVMMTTHDCHFIAMRSDFPTNHHEDNCRGRPVKDNWYPVTCDPRQYRQPQVLPNGDVYSCSMDWGLTNKTGNLLENTWSDLIPAKSFELCRGCDYAMFVPVYYLHRLGVQFFHGEYA